MPAIVAIPQVVEELLVQFGDYLPNEPSRRHFAEYLTGLLVAEHKTVSGIAREFACPPDQSALNRWLRDPALADCAVLINEFGSVAVDHHLVTKIDEDDKKWLDARAEAEGVPIHFEFNQAILDAARRVKAANPTALWCCDPVIGDVGRGVFVRPGIPEFMRDQAVPAHVPLVGDVGDAAAEGGVQGQLAGRLRVVPQPRAARRDAGVGRGAGHLAEHQPRAADRAARAQVRPVDPALEALARKGLAHRVEDVGGVDEVEGICPERRFEDVADDEPCGVRQSGIFEARPCPFDAARVRFQRGDGSVFSGPLAEALDPE